LEKRHRAIEADEVVIGPQISDGGGRMVFICSQAADVGETGKVIDRRTTSSAIAAVRASAKVS
jgi:hypothetical protein